MLSLQPQRPPSPDPGLHGRSPVRSVRRPKTSPRPDPQRQHEETGVRPSLTASSPPSQHPQPPGCRPDGLAVEASPGGWKAHASSPANPGQGPPNPWSDPPDPSPPWTARCPTLPVRAAPQQTRDTPRPQLAPPLALGVALTSLLAPGPSRPSRLASGRGAEAAAGPGTAEGPGDQCPRRPAVLGGPEGAAHGPSSLKERLASVGSPQMAQSGQGQAPPNQRVG